MKISLTYFHGRLETQRTTLATRWQSSFSLDNGAEMVFSADGRSHAISRFKFYLRLQNGWIGNAKKVGELVFKISRDFDSHDAATWCIFRRLCNCFTPFGLNLCRIKRNEKSPAKSNKMGSKSKTAQMVLLTPRSDSLIEANATTICSVGVEMWNFAS